MMTAFLDVVLARTGTWSGMVVSILFWSLVVASVAGFASDWLTSDDLDDEDDDLEFLHVVGGEIR